MRAEARLARGFQSNGAKASKVSSLASTCNTMCRKKCLVGHTTRLHGNWPRWHYMPKSRQESYFRAMESIHNWQGCAHARSCASWHSLREWRQAAVCCRQTMTSHRAKQKTVSPLWTHSWTGPSWHHDSNSVSNGEELHGVSSKQHQDWNNGSQRRGPTSTRWKYQRDPSDRNWDGARFVKSPLKTLRNIIMLLGSIWLQRSEER